MLGFMSVNFEVAIPLSGFDRERDCWTPENPVLKTLTVKTAGDAGDFVLGRRLPPGGI